MWDNVLYVGSGQSAVLINELDLSSYTIVCVNNAWRLFSNKRFYSWVRTNDFPADKYPPEKNFDLEISAKEYDKSSVAANEFFDWRATSPTLHAGYTVFFQGAYWILMNLRPKKISLLGFDHDYNYEKMKFWKSRGMPGLNVRKKDPPLNYDRFQPDFFYGHRAPDPLRLPEEYLINKFDLLEKSAKMVGVELVNLSPVESHLNKIKKEPVCNIEFLWNKVGKRVETATTYNVGVERI